MTPAEQMVGRKMPKEANYRDQLLAGYVKPDGTFCGRSNPNERWFAPAFSKIKKELLIRMGLRISFGGRLGKNDGVWYLTEKGQKEAVLAAERVQAIKAARQAWVKDFQAARKATKATTEGAE